MWKIFSNIFKTFDISDLMDRTDDWGLTKEETVKYQLEWMRALPTGFQIAQRFIGISFSVVFLVMVFITFVLLTLDFEVDLLVEYIGMTMLKPIMIIFSLFFGGGLINSFKNRGNFISTNVADEPILLENKRSKKDTSISMSKGDKDLPKIKKLRRRWRR